MLACFLDESGVSVSRLGAESCPSVSPYKRSVVGRHHQPCYVTATLPVGIAVPGAQVALVNGGEETVPQVNAASRVWGLCLKKETGRVDCPQFLLPTPFSLHAQQLQLPRLSVGGRRSPDPRSPSELIPYQLWRMGVFRLKAPSLRLNDRDQCRSHLALRRKRPKELAMAIDNDSHFSELVLNQIVIFRRNYVFGNPQKASNFITNEIILIFKR